MINLRLKRILTFLLSLILLMTITAYGEEKELQVTVDGTIISFDEKPYIDESGRTQVPIAFVAQKLGAKVTWDTVPWKVMIEKDDVKIELTINSNVVIINNKSETMDTKATIIDGRTFVPIAFISKCLGSNVKWNDATWTVEITKSVETGGTPRIAETVEPNETNETNEVEETDAKIDDLDEKVILSDSEK